MHGELNGETITERLEELRKQIYEVEKSLSKYGFDPRRGIESYKVSELRELTSRSQNADEVKRLLLKLIELQELLYLELYRMAGLKRMNVDTDTPEKRLMTIKEWLIAGRANSITRVAKSKFKEALSMVANVLETCNDNCKEEIKNVLQRVYKRDYDRYRVVRRVLELCTSHGNVGKEILEGIESESLDDLVDRLVECARKMGKEKLARIIKVRGAMK